MKFIENILNAKRRDKTELDFLPAALEIVETPASPIGRAIVYTIIALFCLAIAWACLGKVDIVASASGKIIPNGRTKVIQPFETGVVRAIHVHDGQMVKAGEVLIELDPTMNEAESKHLQSDLIAAQLDVARLQAELAEGDPLANFKPPDQAPPYLVAIQRQFLDRPDGRATGQASGPRQATGAEGSGTANDLGHRRQARSFASRAAGTARNS